MAFQDPFTKEIQNEGNIVKLPLSPKETTFSPTLLPPDNPTIPNSIVPLSNTRTLISSTPKPGYIQGFDTQQGFAPVYVPKGQYVAGISATNNQLTSDKLAPVPGYTLPNGQTGTTAQYDQAIAAAQANSDALAKQREAELAANPPPTAEQKQFQDLLNLGVTNAQAGEQALTDKTTSLNTLNSSEVAAQLDDINAQIQQNTAKSGALDLAYQNANLRADQSNFTNFGAAADKSRNYREYLMQKNELAANALILQGSQAGLQGKYDRAKNLITEAFDSKVALLNAQTATWKAQADALAPTLNRQEQARLEEVKRRKDKEVQDAQDLADAQKQAYTDLRAAGVQVSSDTVLAINKAKDVNDVQNILTQYAPQLARPGQLDIKYKEAQIQNVYDQMRERGGQATQYDPEEILAYARERASTGKSPTGAPKGSFGLIAQIAKELPKPEGSLVDINTGVKSTALSATQEDGILALYDISKKVKELKELDKKRVQGLLPAALGKVFGTEGQGDYIDLRDEIVDLLARARTGAALTSAEEEFYKSQLPGRVGQVGFVFGRNTQSKIDNFDKKINGTLNTRLQGQGTAIYGYSKVKVGDTEYKVGDIISNGEQQARVNPDGTLTIIQ